MLSEFGPLEKASVTQTQITKATQQDLSNHIQLCKTNGISYISPLLSPQNWQVVSPVRQVTTLQVEP